MFVRLGFEWEVFHEDSYVWLNNHLLNKLFSITDNNKKSMILKINEGIHEEELLNEFNTDWIEFKNELLNNNVIIFSKQKSSYRVVFERGGKVIESSNYIRHKNNISRAYLEINNKRCVHNCVNCGEKSEFPCMTCYSSKENSVINNSVIDKFFKDSQKIFIQEVFLTGTNPFDNLEIVKYVTNKVNERSQKPNIYVICNDLINNEAINFVKQNNIILVINIVANECNYLNKMIQFIEKLNGENIKSLVQSRFICDKYENNCTISEYIKENKSIVKINNIVRASNIEINSNFDIRNICKYGKCFINTEGQASVCIESKDVKGNLFNEPLSNILSLLEVEWNDTEEISMCKKCRLKKICIRCPEVIKEYNEISNYCFLHK